MVCSEAIKGLHKAGRRTYMRATVSPGPGFPFGQFMEQDSFMIQFTTKFIKDRGDYQNVISYVAGIQEDTVVQTNDSEVAQAVTVRRGAKSLGKEKVKNPVHLAMPVTFPEIATDDLPLIPCVMRLRGGSEKSLPTVALFAVEEQMVAWQMAVLVSKWLKEQLDELAQRPYTLLG